MVLVILLVLALFFLQTLLPTLFREPPAPGGQSLVAEAFGNRDHVQPRTLVGRRAQRGLANMLEALPVFLALALMNMILVPGAETALTGAWVFLIARVLHTIIYLAGIPFARTLCWLASLVGLALMVAPLLDKI